MRGYLQIITGRSEYVPGGSFALLVLVIYYLNGCHNRLANKFKVKNSYLYWRYFMDRRALILIYFMVIGFLVVSGCTSSSTNAPTTNDSASPNIDPIVGNWTYDPQLKHPFSVGWGAGGPTVDYILAYPDYRIQFFSNHTFVFNSGEYQIVSGPKSIPGIGSDMMSDRMSSGIWYNNGDDNYSIKYIIHDGYSMDVPDSGNLTYRLENSCIIDKTPYAIYDQTAFNGIDYKLIRISE
jgi:hypothetical protein